ncbi:Cytochrome c oxidase subunit 6A1, mitochondrial [Myotis davidii]|uniref:Cytochrome c oxidase subunit 6A1, mitochondrial n=1 Tax=Myotis davidii TaxID=225400 RepID=L5LYQ9_MYODS|nr:Cytochrome c oxidase subunit 6A1, mitochondrial [Myotis davidii]
MTSRYDTTRGKHSIQELPLMVSAPPEGECCSAKAGLTAGKCSSGGRTISRRLCGSTRKQRADGDCGCGSGCRVAGLLGRLRPQLAQPMSSGAHGEEGSARLWKSLTYFVALPGVAVSMLNVFLKSRHGEHKQP